MYQQVLCHQKSFPVSECTSKLSAGDSSLEIINCVCHSSGLSKFLGNIHKKYFLKLHYITYQTIKVRRMHLCMYVHTKLGSAYCLCNMYRSHNYIPYVKV